MLRRRAWSVVVPAILLLAGVAPASAVEVDKYLLDDTDAVLALNVRQIAESPLFKKNYLPLLQKALGSNAEVQKQLKEVGFDPLKDIDRILVVNGESCHRMAAKEGSKADNGVFVIMHGRFDPAKFEARATLLAQFIPKVLHIHKTGSSVIYEITLEKEERTIFLAFPDRGTLVGSIFKDQVQEALDRVAGKKKLSLKSKEVRYLLEKKTDGKMGVWVMASGQTTLSLVTTTLRQDGKKVEKASKQTLADNGVQEVTGGFWVTDGVKAAFGIAVQNDVVAKAVSDALQNELTKAINANFDDKLDDPKLEPVREFLKKLVIAGDGKFIVIQGEVAGRVFTDSLK